MKVYTTHAAYTKFGERWESSLVDLALESIELLKSSGLKIEKIDHLVVGNMLGQLFDNQSQLAAIIAEKSGIQVPATKTEAACASGGLAIYQAASLLKSGFANNVLILGVEKMTDHQTQDNTKVLQTAGLSGIDAQFSITFPQLYALYADAWLHNNWITRKTLMRISMKNHSYGTNNSHAQFQKEITPTHYKNSPMVAEPLCLFDCSPISDGAAAIVLSKKASPDSLELLSISLETGPTTPQNNPSLNGLPAAKKAAKKTFKKSGILPTQITQAEVHDCFTIAEAMALIDTELVNKSDINNFYAKTNPKLKVNQSGGLKACGHPIGATGVKQIAALREYMQKGEYGLSHNIGGTGATAVVGIWKKL